MAGLIPLCLVEKYTFWQSEDDNIIGYEIPKEKSEESDVIGADTESSTRLKIKLVKHKGADNSGFCNTGADAIVQRISVADSDEESENIDKNRPVLTLLNIAMAPAGSLLKQIGMLLSRLDNLSQVLVWSESEVLNAQQACTIDTIELPRVNLSFRAKRVEKIDGTVELVFIAMIMMVYILLHLPSQEGSWRSCLAQSITLLCYRMRTMICLYSYLVVLSPDDFTLMDLTFQCKSYWIGEIKNGSITWAKFDATCTPCTVQSRSSSLRRWHLPCT